MRGLASALLLASSVLAGVSAQPVPLPPTPDSALRLGSPNAQVQIDSFVDLLCPDCAAEWPMLQTLVQHYGADKLSVNLHVFPLPYHTWGFLTAQAAQVIASLNSSSAATFSFFDALFAGNQQQQLWNDATNSTHQALSFLTQLAVSTANVSPQAFAAGMQNADLNMAARISWKYGCSRSVTGTPSLFVNNLPVDADPSWTLQQWEQILDPLFASSKTAKVTLSGFRDQKMVATVAASGEGAARRS